MAEYHVVSVSHIDMAFVMRKEAYAEMAEILLERVISVLERNPEIHFALEQVAHYRNLKERRPELFEKVKALLKAGRLEFMGGMATTMETNFPNGECMVRNQGMGLNWLRENMDYVPHSGWLIDTFGLNPQVPQIMEQFGFRYLHANRFGGNKTRDIFQAEGLNGSRVVIIGCDSMSANVLPQTQALIFCRCWADVDTLFRKADRLRGELPKLVTYYIENEEVFSEYYLKLTKERQAKGTWLHSTYKDYTDALEKSGYAPPVVKDDLNPEFTGTFALRSPIKTENRKTETALLNAELWHALLSEEKKSPFDEEWWDLFHCQFHDAFTGSHEDITYEDILGKFARIQQHSREVQHKVLQLREDPEGLTVCNSLPWTRETWICVDAPDKDVTVWDGNMKLPTVREDNTLYFRAELPAGSISSFRFHPGTPEAAETQHGVHEIRNEHFRLVLDDRCGIQRLEGSDGFCYLENAWDFLTAEEDRGGMQIEHCTGNFLYASSGSLSVEDAVQDSMGEHITMSGTFPTMPWNRQNKLSWCIRFSLRKGERMLRMKLSLDWQGDTTRIRLRLPLSIPGRDFYNEVPFGVVRREAYQNLPTAKGEWPVQRFAALEDGTRGTALLNRGIAGVQQEGRSIVTTLIRAYGNGPDAWVKSTDLSCQNGHREFDFALAAYEGDYRDSGIIPMALEFQQEDRAVAGNTFFAGESLLRLEGKGIVLSAMKKAWDGSGDLIVRLYESEGRRAEGLLTIPGFCRAYRTDLRESILSPCRMRRGAAELTFSPYEIETIRFAQKRT